MKHRISLVSFIAGMLLWECAHEIINNLLLFGWARYPSTMDLMATIGIIISIALYSTSAMKEDYLRQLQQGGYKPIDFIKS